MSSKRTLQHICSDCGLSTSGTKCQLKERIRQQVGGGLDDIEHLYHCTKIQYLESILEHKKLLNRTSRSSSPDESIRTAVGEGSNTRKVGPAKISLENPEYWSDDDGPKEADGVYFRVIGESCYGSESIMLVFDKKILDDPSYTWHINTTENNGFYIADPGVEAKSPFSGNKGKTYDRGNAKDYGLPDDGQELIIIEDVDLKYLDHIRVKDAEMAAMVRKLTELPIFVTLK